MRLILLLIILLIKISSVISAETGYKINISALQFAASDLYLAYHLNGKVYISDTIKIDQKGKGISSGDKKLTQGLYMIYLNQNRNYLFMIEDHQHLSIKIDTLNKVDEFEITGAAQTVAFDRYIYFLDQKSKEKEQFTSKINENSADAISKKEWQDKLEILEKTVMTEQLKLTEEFKNKVLGIFIRGSLQIDIPDAYKDNRLGENSTWRYFKTHYWDNIPLSDERIWRFNYLPQKFDYFMQNVLYQDVDSIIPEAISLIERSKGGDAMAFRIMLSNMLNYASSSNFMGMDKLYAKIASKYYLSGQANWVDSTLLSNINAEVQKSKYNHIGMQAHNLQYINEQGKASKLYDLKSTYTLLYFFEPNCGHCQSTTPLLREVFQKYQAKGFKVLAFYTLVDQKEWVEFRKNYQLEGMNHGWDPQRTSNYWGFFDTSVTPAIYLLDQNKKIVAKKIDMPSLDKFLEYYLK